MPRTTDHRAWLLGALVVGLLIVASTGSTYAKDDELKSAWVGQPIVVDGKFDDWPTNAGMILQEQKVYLGVSNDQENLYLLFRTQDPRWARTIKMSGLTFYVDAKGGKKKNFFVRFKDGPNREQLRAIGGSERRQRPEGDRRGQGRERPGGMPPDMDEMAVDSGPKLTCFIKDRIVEKEIPLDGEEGPSAAFDTARGFFVYELRIPLAEGGVRNYGVGVGPGTEISVGAVWGEMQREQQVEHRPTLDMGGETPRGAMGGGMRGPGMGGPGGGMGRPEKQEVWVKAVLAAEK